MLQRRKLETFCGTYPYLAPEVLLQLPYEPEPSDIWSCGVILVTMLAGGNCFKFCFYIYIHYSTKYVNEFILYIDVLLVFGP